MCNIDIAGILIISGNKFKLMHVLTNGIYHRASTYSRHIGKDP